MRYFFIDSTITGARNIVHHTEDFIILDRVSLNQVSIANLKKRKVELLCKYIFIMTVTFS